MSYLVSSKRIRKKGIKNDLRMHESIGMSRRRESGKVWKSDLPKGAMAMCIIQKWDN